MHRYLLTLILPATGTEPSMLVKAHGSWASSCSAIADGLNLFRAASCASARRID